MNKIAISVKKLNKSFKLPLEKHSTVKGMLVGKYGGKGKAYTIQEALKNVSFEVKDGEFFGIIGRNGSGKSTLLKIIAGIYSPDSGSVEVNGKITPFIELGVGFNQELSGRDNVFLSGAMFGFSRKEISEMYDSIVEFAELEKFMDQKLKNYSSGMQVRLAFSVAVRAHGDILILDEVLAVGDANFQKKCFDVFKRIRAQGRTVVLVTHDMGVVERYCTRAMMLEKGEIKYIGEPSNVAKIYNTANIEEIDRRGTKKKRKTPVKKQIFINDMWIEKKGKKTKALTPDYDIEFFMQIKATRNTPELVAGVTILDQMGRPLFATNTKVKNLDFNLKNNKSSIVKFTIKNTFSDGNYYVVPAVTNSDTNEIYDTLDEGYLFSITGWKYPAFVMQPEHKIKLID